MRKIILYTILIDHYIEIDSYFRKKLSWLHTYQINIIIRRKVGRSVAPRYYDDNNKSF